MKCAKFVAFILARLYPTYFCNNSSHGHSCLNGRYCYCRCIHFCCSFFGNELLNLIWDLNWTWCEHISVFVYNNVTEKKNLIDIKQHLYVLILHVLNTTLQFLLKTYFAFGMKLQICTPGPDGCPRENNSRTSMSYTYAVRTSVSSASKTVALNLPSLYWLTWLLSTVLQCKIDWQALSTSNCFTSFRLIFIWK